MDSINRRAFFTSTGSAVAGLLATSAGVTAPPVSSKCEGWLVLHLYVGNLSNYKAEAFIAKMKDSFRADMNKRGLANWECFFNPQRSEATHIEIFMKDDNRQTMKKLESFYFDLYTDCPKRESIIQQVKDYVLIMLGSPVIAVELTDSQLDFCAKESMDQIDSHFANALVPDATYKELAQKGALAHAKIILGRIRTKWLGLIPAESRELSEAVIQDGDRLLAEGREELSDWLLRIRFDGRVQDGLPLRRETTSQMPKS